MSGYVAPTHDKSAYTCPHCGVYAQQSSFGVLWQGGPSMRVIDGLTGDRCQHCGSLTLWYLEQMIVPLTGNAPLPNSDLPDEIKDDYLEARSIATRSPRGAAALLRLAIDKLTTHLGATGKTIDDRIADLVRKGLDPLVQKALDSVRVIGNESVHPGQIDLQDDAELTASLFWLVNEIVAEMITKPNRVNTIYSVLPASKRDAIDKRNAKAVAAANGSSL